ncbi:MAG: YqgE/AlgH family protein [Flavobacteriales bacterium]|nr:YqgE/AlgH family protein [Flavobacteriales bacterium]
MLKPQKGRLLISAPSMEDSNFFRSVILIAVHNEHESVGFVLNQPTKIKVHHLIENFPKSNFPIYIGGPVERNSLHYIHTIGEKIDGAQEIIDGLYWGGDFKIVNKMVENNEINNSNIRFFAGYSGWNENQLITEARENSWVIVPSNKECCMQLSSNKELWSSFIKKMDIKYAIWTNLPTDPSLN